MVIFKKLQKLRGPRVGESGCCRETGAVKHQGNLPYGSLLAAVLYPQLHQQQETHTSPPRVASLQSRASNPKPPPKEKK